MNPLTRTAFCIECQESFVDGNELKCSLFYSLNVVTGERRFMTCNRARQSETMCGMNGKFFFHRLGNNNNSSDGDR